MTAELDPRLVRRLADLTAVYRMYGRASELLYIGMTSQLRRFDNHATKRWFPLVARIDLEWHPTEASARLAEHRAIQVERPRYNIAGTPLERKRAASRGPAVKAGGPKPPSVLTDVLRVFGDAVQLHWQTLAERLGSQIPERWEATTQQAVSASVRCLGVPSRQVYIAGTNRQGCRRADVEESAARLMLAR